MFYLLKREITYITSLITSLLSVCHDTCQTCTGGNVTDCESCREGYKEEREGKEDNSTMKCVDVNECVEQHDLCPVGQYCVNTEGSYKCEGKQRNVRFCYYVICLLSFFNVVVFYTFLMSHVFTEWKCHPMCERCYGPTHANCFSCKQGTLMRHPFICQGFYW